MGLKGEDHGRAKLTAAQVRAIRRLYRSSRMVERVDTWGTGRTYLSKQWDTVRLAARFGVSKRTVARILKGERWGHLT